jgi:TolB protein
VLNVRRQHRFSAAGCRIARTLLSAFTGPRRRNASVRTPGFASNNGKLVFWSMRDGHAQIYAMPADGSGQTNLSGNPAQEMDPAWSPDGERVAFARSFHAGGRPDIFVMNADGSGGGALTQGTLADRDPAWSPDGTQIVYASRTEAGGPFRLFVMNADGTDDRQLTDGGSNTADDLSPSWSPDGTRIAFSSTRPGGFPQLFMVAPDGTAMKRLTHGDQIDGNPSWSPDGTLRNVRRKRRS